MLRYVDTLSERKRKNKMKITLLIMATGLDSRFGTGIKRLELLYASNHIIVDYSIRDAVEDAFNSEMLYITQEQLDSKNFYAFTPGFDSVAHGRTKAACKR